MAKGYPGIPEETIRFLAALERNNTREWFEQHREDYHRWFEEAGHALKDALVDKTRNLSPDTARVEAKFFRIYRDVRFSRDKTPYRTDIKIGLAEPFTGEACSRPMFGFGLHATQQIISGGRMHLSGDSIKRMRIAIDDDSSGKSLQSIITRLSKKGFSFSEPHYKRVPKGFRANHPREELLRLNALYAQLYQPVTEQTHSAALISHIVNHFRELLPLHAWINEHLC